MRWVRFAAVLAIAGVIGACNDSSSDSSGEPVAGVPPWQRSEEREDCSRFNRFRDPYFGDLHIHTRFSADAYIFGTRGGPADAYRFAQGESIQVSDENEQQTRQVRIERPLDFAAVTDHAEFYGEVGLCTTPGSLVYDDELCQLLRQVEDPEDRFLVTVRWLFPAGVPEPPPSHAFCELPGVDCDMAAVSVWQEIQAAAEEAYDRAASCTFTTFIGYEHTASLFGRHLHRNVIFRNHHVPVFASSQLETFAEGVPQGVWSAVERDCLDAGDGCDAVIIPHNPNLSEGMQFVEPVDRADAQRRQDREPLAEIFQIKGGSECRFDRLAMRGVQTEDELCTFEQRSRPHEGPDAQPVPIEQYPTRNVVRNALKDGLALEESLGVNPFQYGFIGSTDTHNATGGNTEELNWEGGGGSGDASAARRIDDLRDNPGGLAVVWAEENSRDAIFAALRRKETYATSGTRPVLRFFGGTLANVSCDDPALIQRAYESGTSMGGELGPVRGDQSPRFAVFAAKDPGTATSPGVDLQRAQVVKGWVAADGTTREKVLDVAGDAHNGASVDEGTCAPTGAGARELCTVWEDPDFQRSERAFYYVRVLENPSCRWSTILCKNAGVDPFAADCEAQAEVAGAAFANCCLRKSDDPFLEPVIQERAWSSPIWYRPEGIAAVVGGIALGSNGRTDVLDVEIRTGKLPSDFAIETDPIVVRLADDDEILKITIPPGALTAQGENRFELSDSAEIDGLVAAELTVEDDAAVLHIVSGEMDLSKADRSQHPVSLTLEMGATRVSHSRWWRFTGNRLEAPPA